MEDNVSLKFWLIKLSWKSIIFIHSIERGFIMKAILFRGRVILFCVICISLALFAPVFAGDITPKNNEVLFAQKVYKIIKTFSAQDKAFENSAFSGKTTSPDQFKQDFTKKITYHNLSYSQLKPLTPPASFAASYNKLLSGLEGRISALKEMDNSIKQTGKIQPDMERFEKHTTSCATFLDGKKEFTETVLTWKDNYIVKVFPDYRPTEPVKN